jgi:hypothetical protein
MMPYDRLQKRLERLEQPHHGIKITEVILIGQDEPEPPRDPNIRVIQIKLDDPSEQSEAAGR